MAQSDGTANALTIVRVLQILTLIPCWAILAALINVYNSNRIVAPAGVLCLFIVALLASIWAFCVLLTQIRAHNTAIWMAIGDIAIIAGLIAGVVLISNITTRCISGYVPETIVYTTDEGTKVYTSQITNTNANIDPIWDGNNNHCDLAKAAMGLGIANIIFFFISAILAIIIMMQNKKEDEEIIREKIYTRRGSAQYARRSRSHRRHRHRHRDPRTGEYIVEERIV